MSRNSQAVFNRRTLLSAAPVLGLSLAGVALASGDPASTASSGGLPDGYSGQDPARVREMVGVSHGNIARVRELLAEQPALARASWDWGWGDWESALDAAAHVGNREIADLLLAQGARMTLFCAAMLGQLAVVKAALEAQPGIQRTRGPHGITLLSHARAGGEPSKAVLAYLETLGDADPRFPLVELPAAEAAKLAGTYAAGTQAAGTSERDRWLVRVKEAQLEIERPGGTPTRLFHLGQLEFFPTGVESVRMRFLLNPEGEAKLTIEEAGQRLELRRASL